MESRPQFDRAAVECVQLNSQHSPGQQPVNDSGVSDLRYLDFQFCMLTHLPACARSVQENRPCATLCEPRPAFPARHTAAPRFEMAVHMRASGALTATNARTTLRRASTPVSAPATAAAAAAASSVHVLQRASSTAWLPQLSTTTHLLIDLTPACRRRPRRVQHCALCAVPQQWPRSSRGVQLPLGHSASPRARAWDSTPAMTVICTVTRCALTTSVRRHVHGGWA